MSNSRPRTHSADAADHQQGREEQIGRHLQDIGKGADGEEAEQKLDHGGHEYGHDQQIDEISLGNKEVGAGGHAVQEDGSHEDRGRGRTGYAQRQHGNERPPNQAVVACFRRGDPLPSALPNISGCFEARLAEL